MIQVSKEAHWDIIPKIWPGERVFVIGGGPSLRNVEWLKMEGKPMLGCNASVLELSGIPCGIFGDVRFLKNFRPKLRKYAESGGMVINATGKEPVKDNHWMLRMKRINGRKFWGLDPDPSILRWNRSTGGCAINAAVHLGAKEIVLLGFDMKQDKEGNHNFHSAYAPYYVDRNERTESFWMPTPSPTIYREMMMRAFNDIHLDAEKMGIRIINCTPSSALKTFEFRKLEEML